MLQQKTCILNHPQFEFVLYFFPAGAHRVEEFVKLCAVVWVLQVAELMGYNVINALLWRFDQIGVERYRTVAREAPPSLLHSLHRNCWF